MSLHTRARFGRTTVAAAGGALVLAAGAGAAAVYSIPGSPGGPPTAPDGTHGTLATNQGVEALGDALAGMTASELVNQQTVTLTVHFPRAGTIYGRVGVAGVGELGEGFAGRANAGNKPMSVSFSFKGRSTLQAAGRKPVVLQLKYAFQPNVGRTQYSTASVTTAQ